MLYLNRFVRKFASEQAIRDISLDLIMLTIGLMLGASAKNLFF